MFILYKYKLQLYVCHAVTPLTHHKHASVILHLYLATNKITYTYGRSKLDIEFCYRLLNSTRVIRSIIAFKTCQLIKFSVKAITVLWKIFIEFLLYVVLNPVQIGTHYCFAVAGHEILYRFFLCY